MAGLTDQADDMAAEFVLAMFERRSPDPAAVEWMAKAVLRAGREGVPLDQALAFAGTGVDPFAQRMQRELRDQHLAQAALAMAVDGSVDLRERCRRLAPLVRKFESTIWTQPGVRRLSAPPEHWDAWKVHLFHARRLGKQLPGTANGLFKCVNSNPPFCVHARPVRMLARFFEP